jgi:hypothetical protein
MTTPPDINVRPARRPGAGNARGARRCAMARLLLGIGWKLLLPIAVISSAPACIIPIGPDFQDPDGIPNAQPQIVDPNPDWGAEVIGTTSHLFQFTVTDQNPTDDLFLQLVVDDMVRGTISPGMVSHRQDGSLLHQLIQATVRCIDVDTTLARHRVKAAVADRMFDDNRPLVLSDSAGQMDIISWTLNMNCSAAAP